VASEERNVPHYNTTKENQDHQLFKTWFVWVTGPGRQ